MPRSKTGVKRPPVNVGNIEQAVNDVFLKKLNFRQAANKYEVKLGTLHRHFIIFKNGSENVENIDSTNEQSTSYRYTATNATQAVFTKEQEDALVIYLKKVAHMKYGLTTKIARKFVFKYARANQCKFPSTWLANEETGRKWLQRFLKRHSGKNGISMRKPESTSLGRCTSFNKENVNVYFEHLKKVWSQFGPFPAHRVFNLDETGVTTVQNPGKIIAPKGAKQVGKATSAERGELCTVISAINAAGGIVPPLIIFPRLRNRDHCLNETKCFPGTRASFTRTGWSNGAIFHDYLFNHFIPFVMPSKSNPILLVFDNHDSHIDPDDALLAKEKGINIVTLPPHTSHVLQPLDKTVFFPFKNAYNSQVDNYLFTHPGKTFTVYNVADAVSAAYPHAFSVNNIINGFKSTGLYPLDPNKFTNDDFMSAFVTDRPLPCNNTQHDSSSPPLDPSPLPNITSAQNLLPSCSHATENEPHQSDQSVISLEVDVVPNKRRKSSPISPEDVMPFPKASPRKQKKTNRRKMKSTLLTSSPIIKELKEKKTIKQKVICEKEAKKKAREDRAIEKIIKKNASQPRTKKPRKTKLEKPKKQARRKLFEENPSDSASCLICGGDFELHSKNNEEWIQCNPCQLWAHLSCTDYEGVGFYVCDTCRVL